MKTQYIILLALGVSILIMPTALADTVSCTKTKTDGTLCASSRVSTIFDSFLSKIITSNSGTTIQTGSVARFTISQEVKYACPIDTWDYVNVQVYVFPNNDLNNKVDDAFLQVKGDNGRVECGDKFATSFYYGSNVLSAGTYRIYAQFLNKNGGVLTDPEYATINIVSGTISAPISQPTPSSPPTSYTPPTIIIQNPPSATPAVTPTSYTPPTIIIQNPPSATPAVTPTHIDKKSDILGKLNTSTLNTSTLIAIGLIGAGIYLMMRRK